MSDTAKAVAGFLGHKMGYNNIENVPDADLLCALLDRAAKISKGLMKLIYYPRCFLDTDAFWRCELGGETGSGPTPLAALTAAVCAYQGSKP